MQTATANRDINVAAHSLQLVALALPPALESNMIMTQEFKSAEWAQRLCHNTRAPKVCEMLASETPDILSEN